jgi:peroxiredoxin
MIFPQPAATVLLSFAFLCANVGLPARADEKPLPGHSTNGEAFNEGPRQAAALMPGMGAVEFPVTTTSELAQKFFTQGIGQLHGFWYFEAERSFRQAAALDPACAMAYWGMAMANINNPKRATDFMKVAVSKKGATRREQLWISAFGDYCAEGGKSDDEKRKALVGAMEGLIYEFPEDLEAKAFLVFQLWDNSEHGLPLSSRLAVDALAKQILAANPMHPVHHYLIHLWNAGDGDKRAVAAAERCGQAAPGIAHMWHMPGHTYSKLHRYADAAWQQEASARVDHAYMASARIMPEQIHNYAHNNNWLVEDLEYVGRVRDARDLAMNMIELPRLGPSRSRAYNMGRERLIELCVQFELWPNLLALEGSMYLAPDEKPDVEVKRLTALAVASFSAGKMEDGERKLSDLQAQLKRAREERVAAADAAETKARADKKSDDEAVKAMAAAMRGFSYRISANEAAIAEVRIYRELARGKLDAVKPLLAAARDISAERRSRIYLAIGDKDEAVKLARQASDADAAQVQPLANLAGVLWGAGQKDAARESFEKLRTLSSGMDLDLPVIERLAPLVSECNLPTDWRAKAPEAVGAVPKPELKTLGPFRWHPYAAPAWSLDGNDGARHSLADFKGQPVLIVFYLGSGCSRCIEQLNILAPLNKKFSDAGIRIVTVSTESTDGFQRTFSKAHDGNGFPFPILSDSALDAFKAYRAFDDFERMPLHGAFLVDGSGLVRWQNISYEPFRDADWLLGEAKRLLSVPVEETRTAALNW